MARRNASPLWGYAAGVPLPACRCRRAAGLSRAADLSRERVRRALPPLVSSPCARRVVIACPPRGRDDDAAGRHQRQVAATPVPLAETLEGKNPARPVGGAARRWNSRGMATPLRVPTTAPVSTSVK
ncbi:uncharacterized protein SOCE26_040520 [Sorangium cellulosum]|uniref:Uncharacterized protein n=1 Tax=Sorangium cellulosum TaxID=56 RepID=A0A2L0ETL4_SORCE|nr:uncharacterized protein SOCE26_040520 [Sorangium cellulosum]